jgi:hypothetical protein
MDLSEIVMELLIAQGFIAPMRGRKPVHGLPASVLRPGYSSRKPIMTTNEARVVCARVTAANCIRERQRIRRRIAA